MKNIKFKGRVIKGLEVGAKFGIATANIAIDKPIPTLPEGVYFVYVKHKTTNEVFVREKRYNGILHFGELKTFGREQTCEVHLLNFNQDIYEENLEIEILKFLRPTEKFQNADALYTQIEQDITMAEKYFLRKDIYQKWEKVLEKKEINFIERSLEKIEKLSEFLKAKNILIYAPQKDREINFTEKLMENFSKKKYFFPKVTGDGQMKFYQVENYKDLVKGKYDLLEPIKTDKTPKNTPDIVFIPTVAADINGNRLGKGGGFYDRFLDKIDCPTICVLPEFAICEKIPTEEHDKKVGKVVIV